MTEQKHPDPTRAATLAQQIVVILANEDSEIRKRAIQAAMALLGEAIPRASKGQDDGEASLENENSQTRLGAFFNRGDKLKPAESAYLYAAYHYSKYGPEAFSLDELRTVAKEAGVVLPDRLDMTLKQAGNGGRKLFLPAGRRLSISPLNFPERLSWLSHAAFFV